VRLQAIDASRWANADADEMFEYLLRQDEVNWRKVQLWACACVRRIWQRLLREPSRRIVEVVERFADGQASREGVENAVRNAAEVRKGDRRANRAAALLGELCAGKRRFPPGDVGAAVINAVVGDADQPEARAAEAKHQADLLRDIFGNPGRSVCLDRSWLTPTVLALAATAREVRALPSGELDPARLLVLADALEVASCTSADILGHLREPGPHVRGCWPVDAIVFRQEP
jgi:hypothetical protein